MLLVFIVYTRSLAMYHTRPTKTGFYICTKWRGSKAHKTHSFMLRERERERKKERERGMDGQRINRRGKGQNKACTHRGK
jgi:hypothetical protein